MKKLTGIGKKELYEECCDRANWCGKPGKCILIIYGECKNCPYFLIVDNAPPR